jgi:hypothetical protein
MKARLILTSDSWLLITSSQSPIGNVEEKAWQLKLGFHQHRKRRPQPPG